MKRTILSCFAVFAALMFITAPVLAEEILVAPEERPDVAFSPVELAEAESAIEVYVYGKPPSPDTFRIFDRATSETVVLKLEEVLLDEIRPLENDHFALDARFVSEDGVPYILSFAIGQDDEAITIRYFSRRDEIEPIERLVVKDVTIRKSGDREIYEWTQVEDTWELRSAE